MGDGDGDRCQKKGGWAGVESSDGASQQRLSLRMLDWGEKADAGDAAALAVRLYKQQQEEEEKLHFEERNMECR